MNRRQSFSVVCGLALVGCGLTAGCSSSPQMSRIDRHRDIYETWPLETRQAVLDGKVEPGMNVDMVRVAWGDPTEMSTTPAGDEIWIYQKGGSPGSVYYPGGGLGSSGIYGQPGVYSPGTGIGMGNTGTGIGISTGRGGTSIGTSTGIGMGIGGMSGLGGMGSSGALGGPIVTPPTPPEVREVVFRDGLVVRADKP